tara:strand:- start:798 stop:1343 length:546 start_codon:yes stop_codon:yes gene_type:complete
MDDKKERIKIFDDVFEYQKKEQIYDLALNSNFQIGWADTSIIEHSEKVFMYSRWDHQHINFAKKKFLPFVKNQKLIKLIDGRLPTKVILNCSIHSDIYLPHTHRDNDVLLYYINMDWKREWNGETQFLSENLNEIIFTNPYVPGRMVWFDGCIPHTIKTQSFGGPKYRFSVSLFFRKSDEC